MKRIVVAVDESDAGRWAARAALDIAAGTGAEVIVLRTVALAATPALARAPESPVVPVEQQATHQLEVERLRRWLDPEIASARSGPASIAITYGVPSIEICRFAEDAGADLLILGRKRRSAKTRLLIGDTADSVARRSRLPCLFVPPGSPSLTRILAGLDGTDRGLAVLTTAHRLAATAGAELRTVTVEPPKAGESASAASALPLARSTSLEQRLRSTLGSSHPGARLQIRRGPAVEQILAALEETDADTLAVGYPRGGPAGIIEAGSTGRRLLHAAPGAVLTIPL
jgi:nucleotide-binding universal stress UspA family protein